MMTITIQNKKTLMHKVNRGEQVSFFYFFVGTNKFDIKSKKEN
jgi:hypothetical protein